MYLYPFETTKRQSDRNVATVHEIHVRALQQTHAQEEEEEEEEERKIIKMGKEEQRLSKGFLWRILSKGVRVLPNLHLPAIFLYTQLLPPTTSKASQRRRRPLPSSYYYSLVVWKKTKFLLRFYPISSSAVGPNRQQQRRQCYHFHQFGKLFLRQHTVGIRF